MAKTKINKNQLANVFVESVNEQLPDANGDVLITNVATADNLTSPDNINDYGTFIFRTSAGTKSIASDKDSADATYLSEATLMSIQGEIKNPRKDANNIVDNYIQSSTPRFTVAIDAATFGVLSFVNNTSGTYVLTFDGTNWVYDNEGTSVNVDLATAGITVTPAKTGIETVTNDYITVNYTYETTTDPDTGTESVYENASGIYTTETKLVFAPTVEATFAQKVNEVIGDYTFNYNGNAWMLGDTLVDLAEYGISYTGVAIKGDIFEVTYNGAMEVATPTSFVTSSFNQFNPANVIPGYKINSDGSISADVNYSIAYIKGVGGLNNAYGSRFGDYTIYDANTTGTIERVAFSKTIPTNESTFITSGNEGVVVVNKLTLQNPPQDMLEPNQIQYITFPVDGYICVSMTNTSKLCVHPEWSGYMDTTYQEYIAPVTWENNPLTNGKRRKPSIINIPTQGVIADGSSTELVDINCKDYLARVGLVYDEIRFEEGKYINRIGRYTYSQENLDTVIALGVDYVYDSNYIYYVLPNAVTYNVTIDGNGKYMVCDFGTEEFTGTEVAVLGNFLYGNNLVDKLRTDVLTKSAQSLSQEQKEQVWQNLGLQPIYNHVNTLTANATVTINLVPTKQVYELTPTSNTTLEFNTANLTEFNAQDSDVEIEFTLYIKMVDAQQAWEITFPDTVVWGNTSPTMTAMANYKFSFCKPKGSSVFIGNQMYSWVE